MSVTFLELTGRCVPIYGIEHTLGNDEPMTMVMMNQWLW